LVCIVPSLVNVIACAQNGNANRIANNVIANFFFIIYLLKNPILVFRNYIIHNYLYKNQDNSLFHNDVPKKQLQQALRGRDGGEENKVI
jgi:hypothetical protein